MLMSKAVFLVPAALLVQAAIVQWAASGERPPTNPDLASFTTHLGSWNLLKEDPLAADVLETLKADRILSRTYQRLPEGTLGGLLVVWFQTQSRGDRQPHSPQVCLPGSGWTPILRDTVTIEAAGTRFPANRYVASYGGQRAVILYWYQSSQRAVASEWESKLWTVWDALSVKRTDIALVRLVLWPKGDGYDQATAEGLEFARSMYPALRETLPR